MDLWSEDDEEEEEERGEEALLRFKASRLGGARGVVVEAKRGDPKISFSLNSDGVIGGPLGGGVAGMVTSACSGNGQSESGCGGGACTLLREEYWRRGSFSILVRRKTRTRRKKNRRSYQCRHIIRFKMINGI